MTASPSLKSTVSDLLGAGKLRYGSRYRKTDLIKLFGSVAGDAGAEETFAQLRSVVGYGRIAEGLHVHTTGARRGMKYTFTERDEKPAPTDQPPASRRAQRQATPVASDRGRVTPTQSGSVQILAGDNLALLQRMEAAQFRLIYVDPPFNTGKRQARTRISTIRDDENGDRTGFKGQRYRTVVHGTKAFGDAFDDYLGFLAPRLEEAHRLLTCDGSLFLHLDYREIHYAKVLLDQIFGRESFINEIVWAYDYGARSKRKWSAKHDNILWYAKDPERYVFNFDEMDRIPYMAPGLVGPEKAARGKTPTDVWWHTIVSPNGREKTGYPTQKPLGVLDRIVKVHSMPGDTLLDFFAGSGTLGEAGASLGRDVTLIDNNDEALSVMRNRLTRFLQPNEPVAPPTESRNTGVGEETVVGPSTDHGMLPSRATPTQTTERATQRDLFT